MMIAAIVTGQDKIGSFRFVGNISEFFIELCDVFYRCGNISFGFIQQMSWQAYVVSCFGHNLHEATCTSPTARLGVKCRFLITLGSKQSPVYARHRGILLEQMVVFGNDTSALVEHGGIDMTLDAMGGESKLLFLDYLGNHYRFEPAVKGIGKSRIGIAYCPTGFVLGVRNTTKLYAMDGMGEWDGGNVALALLQPMDKFCRIFTYFNAERYSKCLCKLFAKQILGSHASAVIFVIGLRAGKGEHDNLAIVEDIVKSIVGGYRVCIGLKTRAPGRLLNLLVMLTSHEQKRKNYE